MSEEDANPKEAYYKDQLSYYQRRIAALEEKYQIVGLQIKDAKDNFETWKRAWEAAEAQIALETAKKDEK